jgi:4-azaleucine resistance transporter AzlC
MKQDIRMQDWKQDFFSGARMMMPLTIAVAPIGLIFGVSAAAKGLSVAEAGLMSALVFAGGSQFVALDLWTRPAAWAALGLAAFVVNIRHVLLGMSIGRKMEAFPKWLRYLSVLFLADEIWAMAEKRAWNATLTPAWYAGLAIPFYLTWVAGGFLGSALGTHIGNPAALGLDFAFAAVFIVLLVGFWKGRETGVILLASAAASVSVHAVIPGAWYIAAGAAAGIAAAIVQEYLLPRKVAQ